MTPPPKKKTKKPEKKAIPLRGVILTSPHPRGYYQTHTAIDPRAAVKGSIIRLKPNPFFRLPDVPWTVAMVGEGPFANESSKYCVWWSEVVGYETEGGETIADRVAEMKLRLKRKSEPRDESDVQQDHP